MPNTILIVEDNELDMKLENDLLNAAGYLTVQTGNGDEVLELATEHHPDLIIMDVQLPECSGLDATKRLKADDDLKDIPVVVVTAFAIKEYEEMLRDAGCDDYITKPISVSGFLGKVANFIG